LRNNRRVRSLVDGMHREAKRLDGDIQNLLDSMRITDTGVKPVMEWTDPADVITAAIRQRSHRLAAHRLDVDIADGLPLLKLDSGLIEQAVGQVIENAGKYSPVDSTISIMVRADSGELIIAVTASLERSPVSASACGLPRYSSLRTAGRSRREVPVRDGGPR
jgi:K+-sensing histidine kinase KdpD